MGENPGSKGWLFRRREPRRRHKGCRASRPGLFWWALIVALPLALIPLTGGPRSRITAFWVLFVDLLLLLACVGWQVRRTWRGIAVTGRNVVSLAAFQTVLWLGVVGAALLAGLLATLWAHPSGPVTLGLPESVGYQVGAAAVTGGLGTAVVAAKARKAPSAEAVRRSARSLAGASPTGFLENLASEASDAGLASHLEQEDQDAAHPETLQAIALLQQARGWSTDDTASALTGALAGGSPALEKLLHEAVPLSKGQLNTQQVANLVRAAEEKGGFDLPRLLQRYVERDLGRSNSVVYHNLCPCEARFGDMVRGDEAIDTTQLDLAKLQFLAFTLLGVAAFVVAVHQGLWQGVQPAAAGAAATLSLGSYPLALTELLGLSGVGYVGNKVPVRTRTVADAAADAVAAAPDPAVVARGVRVIPNTVRDLRGLGRNGR